MAAATFSSFSLSSPDREYTMTETLLCMVATLEWNTMFWDSSSG